MASPATATKVPTANTVGGGTTAFELSTSTPIAPASATRAGSGT